MKEVLGVKLYNLDEVGAMLGVQAATARRYVQSGKLQARTISGRKYVSEQGLKDFLLTSDDDAAQNEAGVTAEK